MRTLILIAALCASAHAKDRSAKDSPLPLPHFETEREKRVSAAFNDGQEDLMLGHFERAIRVWEEGFRDTGWPDFLYWIGEAHRERLHPWRALESYREYLRVDPNPKYGADAKKRIRALEKLIRGLERDL